MNLAVNKDFTVSSFDLHSRVGFDGPAEPVDRPLVHAYLTGGSRAR